MTAEQWGALLVLLNGDAMTQGQLGEQLGLEKSSVSRLTDGLEKRGWIVRVRDPEDSRKKLVSPTQEARKTATRCEAIARAVLSEAQQNMTDEQQRICQSHLSLVITNLRGLT
ncbi:Organic hydroperoxide resistance transcriptional regulator [Vibrio mangrovi]|nr:Organic hydroperoxide resistance transcriptional regulator [Vibrio mangrovi]